MTQERINRPPSSVVYICTFAERPASKLSGEQVIDCVAETAATVNEHRIDIYV